MALLVLHHLCKRFEQPAVEDVSLTVDEGEIVCLLGPSGCGKTTLLRLVAGLELPDRGRVVFNGRDVTREPPHLRQFGLMFQEFALFPHKSVFENVAFGPKMQALSRDRIKARTEAMLSLTGLSMLGERNVADLSGGERQRVALARSLAPQPKLLMLDEPLGALDRALRERLLGEIRGILKRLAVPALFVTHDQSEALAVADRIAVMNRGRIEQMDNPEALYRRPQSVFVARFLGFKNILRATLQNGIIISALGRFAMPAPVGGLPQGAVKLILRPESVRLATGTGDGPFAEGKVIERFFGGKTYRVKMATEKAGDLTFDITNETPPPLVGETIRLKLNCSEMIVIAAVPDKVMREDNLDESLESAHKGPDRNFP